MTRSANRLLAVILCFAFYGCTFGDEKTNPANGYTNDGNFIQTDYAVRKNWAGGTVIAFTDLLPTTEFTGKVNAVQFLLDTLEQHGDYTYMPSDSAAFDKTKNFDIAILYKNVHYMNGTEVDNSGQTYSKPTAGTLTFTPGPGYQTFSYTLKFGSDHVISGCFRGQVTSVE
ncbi:hypothetical protein [Chitinophaga pinensis]|uniref:Uncharacterized protein n=1 Tax=Chitinophaga pinensis (strain ATCC 43595 / DSM 2588 / LMG 13176 / NBRC 15968 / NCIMB 11800 / UQM 2034) TaxID=485918 RepID=A0A979GNK4_CHIPD|nr:hypothetical protein [Chitinophaga pinensis]ACU59647.1 hypothetical protein Cpin_2155 [Chitinophaga pinensis DSM 2588]